MHDPVQTEKFFRQNRISPCWFMYPGRKLFSLEEKTSLCQYHQPMIQLLISKSISICSSQGSKCLILLLPSLSVLVFSSPTKASLMGWSPCWTSVTWTLPSLAGTPFAVEEPHIFILWVVQACRFKHQVTGQQWHFWGTSTSLLRIGGHPSYWCQKDYHLHQNRWDYSRWCCDRTVSTHQ